MGACFSSAVKQLRDDNAETPKKLRLLILGSGESGKSTILKQMRRGQQGIELTRSEQAQTQVALCHNTIDCLKSIVGAAQRLDLEVDSDFKAMLTDTTVNTEDGDDPALPMKFVMAAEQFLQSDTYSVMIGTHRNSFWILDAYSYYFNNMARFSMRPYEATDDDWVLARVKTTGIVKHTMQISNPLSKTSSDRTVQFEIVDVAGQRGERRKWMHHFDDVQGIVFVVNLDGYSTRLYEDESVLRMTDELALFKIITCNSAFNKHPIVLILNKKDLFEQSLRHIPLKTSFPDYNGPEEDVGEALSFVSKKFKAEMPEADRERLVVFQMSARVRREVKCAFDDIFKQMIMRNSR